VLTGDADRQFFDPDKVRRVMASGFATWTPCKPESQAILYCLRLGDFWLGRVSDRDAEGLRKVRKEVDFFGTAAKEVPKSDRYG